MPQSLRPCLRFSFVVNRLTMSLSERPCDQKSISRKHDSLALNPLLMNCPDARSWFQHYNSACIPTMLSLAQRGLVDDMYSVAHSALHRCATSCFGAQKSAPKPRKPWTSQGTVAMSVWRGPARHQLHRFRKVLKLVNTKCIMLGWRNVIGQIASGRVLDALRERFLQRGAEACALLTMRIQRSAMKRAITDDLQACLGKLAGEANEAAAKGDMGRVFAIAKKLKLGMTDRTESSVTRTEFYWSTRITSLPGGDATGLSSWTGDEVV